MALIAVKNGEARFEVIDRATDDTILAKDGIEIRGILLLRGEIAGLACVLHFQRASGFRKCPYRSPAVVYVQRQSVYVSSDNLSHVLRIYRCLCCERFCSPRCRRDLSASTQEPSRQARFCRLHIMTRARPRPLGRTQA